MTESTRSFASRKADHIRLALDPRTETYAPHWLDTVHLPHQALPEINFKDITLENKLFGRKLATPFLVSSMTAGHGDADRINTRLMQAASDCGWAMGVGSQRRELFDQSAGKTWSAMRQHFPHLTLFSNIGIAQLIEYGANPILRLIENLNAQGIIIHLNPLQEVLQDEGTTDFAGGIAALASLRQATTLPIIVKETGCGLSRQTLQQLQTIGVDAVDVSGLGGTHWGRIEGYRSTQSLHQRAAETFQNWGIPTLTALRTAVALHPNYAIWGSGGLRNGLDCAKLLAEGASVVGLARPLMVAAVESTEAVIEVMRTLAFELKVALFCTGSLTINHLRENYRDLS